MKYLNSRKLVEATGRAGADYDGEKSFWLNEFWLYVEPDDQAFTVHWNEGFWEAWITAWMDVQLDTHDVFLDVGANVGYYTFMAASRGIPVVSFEPQQHLVSLLVKSAIENKADNVDIVPFALSDKSGRIALSSPAGHSGGASIVADFGETSGHELVQTVMLDELKIPSGERYLIKVDAEGAEPLIWEGMKEFRNREKFTAILEWCPSRYPDAPAFADELLEYNVSVVDTEGYEQPIDKHAMLSSEWFDMVVVRNF